MPLTDPQVRNAKPQAGKRITKLFDERGLYLELPERGGRWWRFKYRFGGKEKRLALGSYPEVTLKKARDERDRARELLRQGVDPGEVKKARKAARAERAENSFEVIAREWYAKQAPTWADAHGDRILRRLERDVFPWLGGRPVAEITPQEILLVLRRIEGRGVIETAHRALSNCSAVFRYAVATGRATHDPTRDLRGALAPARPRPFPAITDPERVAQLLREINAYQGTFVVSCALKLAPLVFVRPGELRMAKWAEIDLEAAEWCFVASKSQPQHIVPLAHQAVDILRELRPLTGDGVYVFPSQRSRTRPMSDNAILAAFRRMGIAADEMVGHGFRAMARTILDEVLHFPPELIEHQLAHAVRDPLGRAYNRTKHLPQRRAMMQQWADYLDRLRTPGATSGVKGVA